MTPERDSNSYVTPTAQALASDMHSGRYPGRRVPASAWVGWYGHGWEQFCGSPLAWVGATLSFVVICAVILLVPLGQFAAQALQFVFLGGLVLGCRDHDAGHRFRFRYLFEGFTAHGAQLALIGALCTLAFIAFFLLVGIGVGVSGIGLTLADWTNVASITHALFPATILLVLLLIFLSALGMAVWFAPALVVLYDVRAWTAMKMSFHGFWHNMVPLTLFGLVWVVLALCASLLLGLGYLVLLPVTVGAIYISTREVFEAPASE